MQSPGPCLARTIKAIPSTFNSHLCPSSSSEQLWQQNTKAPDNTVRHNTSDAPYRRPPTLAIVIISIKHHKTVYTLLVLNTWTPIFASFWGFWTANYHLIDSGYL